MNMKRISLAAAVALVSTVAFAQGNAVSGNSQAGAPKTNAGDNMNNSAYDKTFAEGCQYARRGDCWRR